MSLKFSISVSSSCVAYSMFGVDSKSVEISNSLFDFESNVDFFDSMSMSLSSKFLSTLFPTPA